MVQPGELLPVLKHVTEEAAAQLESYFCHRVKLVLHVRRGGRLTATRILPEAVADPKRLLQASQTLLAEAMQSPVEIEGVTIELGSLRVPPHQQQSLFIDRPDVFDAARAVLRKYPGMCVRARVNRHEVLPEKRTWFEPVSEHTRSKTPLPRKRSSSVRSYEADARRH